MVSYDIGHNPSVVQIQNSAEIEFVDLRTNVVFELRYICLPLFVRHIGVKMAVQVIPCNVLRIGRLSGAAVVPIFNRGFDVQTAADAQDPLLVHLYLMIVCQVILDPPVALIWALIMDLFHKFRNLLVLQLAAAFPSTQPPVICSSCNPK